MTPDDAAPLLRYWRRHPPVALILEAVHMKPSKASALKLAAGNDATPAELIAAGVMIDNTGPDGCR